MLRRRIGRPGLLGTMARTAVIAGTATAVSGGIQRNQQARAQNAADQQQMEADVAALQAQQAFQAQQTQPVQPSGAGGDDTVAQLAKLGDMRRSGLINEAEFDAAKARLLGI